MLKNKYRLCEFFGIPVYVDISFLILLVIFITDFKSFSVGVAMGLVLAISVVMHEFGHALTARAFGFYTNDITISLLGGCASMTALPRKAWQELLTSVAGPAVSFLLAALAYGVLVFFSIENYFLRETFFYMMCINVMLGAFNLLPGFPMDGGRIFRSVMSAFLSRTKATYIAMAVGRVFAVLLGLKGIYSIFTGGGWGIVTLMIAWMVWRESWREYEMTLHEERSWSQADFRARVSPPPYDR